MLDRAAAIPIAALPEPEVIERMINATFWASLRREEGYVPKISMAFLPPEHTGHPMMLATAAAARPAALTKVAAIVEHAGIHLGVWEIDGELCIWGTAHNIPIFCFVLEVVEPGLIVIKHHRGEQSGKYVNVAVLEGDQIKVVDESATSLPDCPGTGDVAAGFRFAGVVGGFGERARAARGFDAQPWPRRLAARSCPRKATHGASQSCTRFDMRCRRRSESCRC